MKSARLIVPWEEGLHARPAARLVRLARASKSAVLFKVGARVADARSIIALLLLSAAAGTIVDLEVSGEDEDAVAHSIAGLFHAGVDDSAEKNAARAL